MADLTSQEKDRLKILEEEWNKEAGQDSTVYLTPSDLKLMLCKFKPLIELLTGLRVLSKKSKDAEDQLLGGSESILGAVDGLDKKERLIQRLESKLLEREAQLSDVQKQMCDLQERFAQNEQERQSLSNELAQTRQRYEEVSARVRQLEEDLGRALQEVEKHKSRSEMPAILDSLNRLPEVLRRMNLLNLPENPIRAIIQVVAVLSQKENLERLWDVCSDEVSRKTGSVRDDCSIVLGEAVTWYNYNWQSKQVALNRVESGAPFDFSQHQRSLSSPQGETVIETVLPGLIASDGKVIKKAIVVTK
mgnify:FL=1